MSSSQHVSTNYSTVALINTELAKHKEPKLHLGCFNKKLHGFINVDIRADVGPELVLDIYNLDGIPNNSISLIYASHVLEHVERKLVSTTLQRWYDVLRPGGVARIAVPDMECIFAHYFYHKNLKLLYSALGGSQRHPYDFHYSHFDEPALREALEVVGFKNVKRYDRWKTEHASVDDYSAAYWPHLDFVNGKLMSLNVEATK